MKTFKAASAIPIKLDPIIKRLEDGQSAMATVPEIFLVNLSSSYFFMKKFF